MGIREGGRLIMKRFLYRHLTPDRFLGALMVILVLLVYLVVSEERRMIDDCVATTGRDYYECRALVKGAQRTPVIINPGRF